MLGTNPTEATPKCLPLPQEVKMRNISVVVNEYKEEEFARFVNQLPTIGIK